MIAPAPPPRGSRRAHRILAAALASALASAATLAPAGKGDFKIAPGPATMSEEEKAIAADPSKGMEHGVVLLREEERDDSLGTDTQVSFHLRAKILSQEGRDLGNVEIPFNPKTGQLKQWWGRVILPDGQSLALRQDQLKPQTVTKTNGQEYQALKGALPGVAPGCVIDYGYVFWDSGISSWTRLAMQLDWPTRALQFRWIPFAKKPFKVWAARTEDLQVTFDQGSRGLIVLGKEIPRVAKEPYMPSEDAVRGFAHLYYVDEKISLSDFWNEQARAIDRDARAFAAQGKALETMMASMNLPSQGGLKAKLKAAYDWIGANIRNTAMLTSEEEEKNVDPKKRDEEREKRTFSQILDLKEALPAQLDQIFLGVARALGADANLVYATDRTENYWDPGLFTMKQFDWVLVAAREPGAPDDQAILVDTGSGLPFGEIPWLVTGTKGFLASPKGYREIPLWPSEIDKNVSESKVRITFDEEGAKVAWSRTGQGQQGYFLRRELRGLPPEERTKRLDEVCGSGSDLDITKAEAPKVLADPSAPYEISCEGDLTTAAPDASAGTFSFKVDGPWFSGAPELSSTTRTHPVVFSYPRIDRATVEIKAPPGFAPRGPVPSAEAESKFGRYTLEVKPTAEGYRLSREFWFAPLIVKPEEYETLRSFLLEVHKADAARVEFKKAGN